MSESKLLKQAAKLRQASKELKKIKRTYDSFPSVANEKNKEIVARWYANYNPTYYRRTRSLYQAYRIKKVGNRGIEITSGASNIGRKHHQKPSVIYNNVFLLGFHGGSFGEGLEDDQPHWRTPFLDYSSWGQPAVSDNSPYDEISDFVHSYWEKNILDRWNSVQQKLDDVEKSMG